MCVCINIYAQLLILANYGTVLGKRVYTRQEEGKKGIRREKNLQRGASALGSKEKRRWGEVGLHTGCFSTWVEGEERRLR